MTSLGSPARHGVSISKNQDGSHLRSNQLHAMSLRARNAFDTRTAVATHGGVNTCRGCGSLHFWPKLTFLAYAVQACHPASTPSSFYPLPIHDPRRLPLRATCEEALRPSSPSCVTSGSRKAGCPTSSRCSHWKRRSGPTNPSSRLKPPHSSCSTRHPNTCRAPGSKPMAHRASSLGASAGFKTRGVPRKRRQRDACLDKDSNRQKKKKKWSPINP